jgi:hypothetical protein
MVSSMYETNYYWDDAAAAQDYVDFHVAATDSTIEERGEEIGNRVIPPELRWDFDTLPAVQAGGSDVRLSQQRVDDADWGSRSRTTGVLRITGTGSIQLTLPGEFDPSEFQYAYVRFRRVEGATRTLTVASRALGEMTVSTARQIVLGVRRAGMWEVAMIPFTIRPRGSLGLAATPSW